MPPVNQQGRTSLITAVVVFAILFVTALVFALYYNAESRKSRQDLEVARNQYKDAVSQQFLSSTDMTDLKNLRGEPTNGFDRTDTAMDVVIKQRDRLAKLITGSPKGGATAAVEAEKAGKQRLTDAAATAKAASVVLPANTADLNGGVTALAKALTAAQQRIGDLNQQLKALNGKYKTLETQYKSDVSTRDKVLADKRQEADKAIAAAAADRAGKQQQVDDIQKSLDQDKRDLQTRLDQKDRDLLDLTNKLRQSEKRLDATLARTEAFRPNVKEPLVRQGDGVLTRIPGNNTVFINRGLGDQIVPGLTFEVYDKRTGVPALGDASVTSGESTDENLPKGKASIEVIHVGPASSECRIVKIQPAAALQEGDVIANLVYDANTKYNFVVYGKFDLDQNGVATPQDTEVVKRLVSQWGGRVVDRVSVDTDFVVVGKEPVVPVYTTDELQDPINKKKLDDAQAELKQYDDIVEQARSLHVPIMNQNRFLYFTGYFDLAKR